MTDPQTGERVRCWEMVDTLVEEVLPELRAHGDDELVLSTLDWLRDVGGGAERQRRLFRASDSPATFLAALARATGTGIGA